MLRMLRAQDEETFERILKELKIAYHVPPPPEELPRYTRKGWIEFIVRFNFFRLYCVNFSRFEQFSNSFLTLDEKKVRTFKRR